MSIHESPADLQNHPGQERKQTNIKDLFANLRGRVTKFLGMRKGKRQALSNGQFSNYAFGETFLQAAWYISIFKVTTYT